jgi:hypothetical protein
VKKALFFSILGLSFGLLLLTQCGGAAEPEVVLQPGQGERAAPEPTGAITVVETAQVERAPREAPPADEQLASASNLAAQPVARAQRMIIKNAEMELLVSDADAALDSVTLIASEYGGYIISSHSWYEQEHKYATVRLGVPVEEFENVLRRLRGLALRVLNEIASGEDVTDQYVDLQSRLTNLEATRDRIREFLDKATTVEEALQVNEQLSEIEGQIEEIQGKMNYLRDRAAYSTIDVQLSPEIPTPTPSPTATPTPTPTPEAWRPLETARGATDVLAALTKGLLDVLIWVLIVLGPFLLVIALIVGLIIWWRHHHRSARPAPPQEPSEPGDA